MESLCDALEILRRDKYPQDRVKVENGLGRALQVMVLRGGFARGFERIDRLTTADGLRGDPVEQASLRALTVFTHAAIGQDAEARRALTELVLLVERQPVGFQLAWEWSTLRTFLADSKEPAVVARRQDLSKLLDALEPGRDRVALLTDLKGLATAFSGPGTGAGK